MTNLGRSACLTAVVLSGASALILEVLWQRQMFLTFGASAPATTAVLTAIFLGIAFGSLLANRVIAATTHLLVSFSAMEIIIGVWGLLVPSLLPLGRAIYGSAALQTGEESLLLNGVRFVIAVSLLLPATLCMGATMLIMAQLLHRVSISAVYGLNALGAVAGAAGTGLILLPNLGQSSTRLIAVACNLMASLLPWIPVLIRRGRSALSPESRTETRPPDASALRLSEESSHTSLSAPLVKSPRESGASLFTISRQQRLPLLLYFISGYAALGLEVVWLRFLGIVNSNSTVTFSLTLATCLTGFSVGSLAGFPLLFRWLNGRIVFAVANMAAAVMSLSTLPVIYQAPLLNYRWISVRAAEGTLTLSDIYRTESFFIVALMFVPCFFMGLVYPAACHWSNREESIPPEWKGILYFSGTLGSVVGILSVSLLVIPHFGLHGTFVLLSVISGAVGMIAARGVLTPGYRTLMAAMMLFVVVVGVYRIIESRPVLREFAAVRKGRVWYEHSVASPEQVISEIRQFRAGHSGTVIVKKKPENDDHLVYVDDQLVASTNLEARVDALMLAHLPLLLHPAPQDQLTVGFGSGGTSYAISTHGVEAYCVEIEAEVPRASELLVQQNFRILSHPRFHLILNDARDHLSIGFRQYDVIATDVTNLQYKQNSSLYTVEYFSLMKRQLRPGGVACAWIPMAAISTDELRILMKSFQYVFPHATLWYLNHTHTNFGILIGTPEPLIVDFSRLQEGMNIPSVAENLRQIGITDPLQILTGLHLTEDGYRKFCGDAPLHTDNDPVLEFTSPLSFYQYNQTFRDNLAKTLPLRPQISKSIVSNLPDEQQDALKSHQIAADAFCDVVVGFYDFLLKQGRGQRQAAKHSLVRAVQHAERGMTALPDDKTREAFYVNFFTQAQQWLE